MTLRSPLVLGADGLPQQLQPGDTISAPMNTPSLRAVTNGEASAALPMCTPVYTSAADAVKRAQANAKTTGKVAGLVNDASIASGAIGNIAQSGIVVATTAQWDAVAGTTGGLAPNTYYFLDAATAGKITATAPTTVGQVNTLIGLSISATALEVDPIPPILL